MHAQAVIDAVNEIHFMPTWEIKAERLEDGTVGISATWDTQNSDQNMALLGYPEEYRLWRGFKAVPADFERVDDLRAAVLAWLIDLLTHEAREFFRVGSRMRAPFHPHRPEGEALWNRYVDGIPATANAR